MRRREGGAGTHRAAARGLAFGPVEGARTHEKPESEGGQREAEEEEGARQWRGRTVRGGAELCAEELACVSVSVCACMWCVSYGSSRCGGERARTCGFACLYKGGRAWSWSSRGAVAMWHIDVVYTPSCVRGRTGRRLSFWRLSEVTARSSVRC